MLTMIPDNIKRKSQRQIHSCRENRLHARHDQLSKRLGILIGYRRDCIFKLCSSKVLFLYAGLSYLSIDIM